MERSQASYDFIIRYLCGMASTVAAAIAIDACHFRGEMCRREYFAYAKNTIRVRGRRRMIGIQSYDWQHRQLET